MAACYLALTGLLLTCLVKPGNCQTAQLTVSPQVLTLSTNQSDSTGGQVTVSCSSSGLSNSDILLQLFVARILHSSPTGNEAVARAEAWRNNGNAEKLLTSLTADVTGSIGSNNVQVVMTAANCNDGALYSCAITVSKASGGTHTHSTSQNVTVQVSPGAIHLAQEQPESKVNYIMKLTCNGIVGSADVAAKAVWVWEYRDQISTFWTNYDGDQSENEAPFNDNPCYKRQISVLTRQLTMDDNNRFYRCYVQGYEQFAQEYSVGTVTQDGNPGTGGNTDNNNNDCMDIVMIDSMDAVVTELPSVDEYPPSFRDLAIALGVMLALLVFVNVVILIMLWKRQWILPCNKLPKGSFEVISNQNFRAGESQINVIQPANPTGSGVLYDSRSASDVPYDSLCVSDIGRKSVYSTIYHDIV